LKGEEQSSKYSKSTLFSFIIRIWTLHAVAFVVCIIVLTAIAPLLGDTAGGVLSCIVGTVLFTVLSYLEGWRTGSREANLIKYGRIRDDRLKGVKAAVISQLPGFALAIYLQFPAAPVWAGNFIRYFYLFAAYLIQQWTQKGPQGYFLPILLPLITVIGGYALGRRDIRLVNILVYRRGGGDDDDDDEKRPR